MLESIRGKDRHYKIKKVILNDDANCIADTDLENAASNQIVDKRDGSDDDDDDGERYWPHKPRAHKQLAHQDLGLMSYDRAKEDGDDDDDDFKSFKKPKKTKAILDYKNAINNIGSKSTKLQSNDSKSGHSSKTKSINDIVVSEKEYNSTDDWLIDDLNRKNKSISMSSSTFTNTTNASKKASSSSTSSNKRKLVRETSDLEDLDINSQNEIYVEDDDNSTSRKLASKSDHFAADSRLTTNHHQDKSPKSKKRFVDLTDSDSNASIEANSRNQFDCYDQPTDFNYHQNDPDLIVSPFKSSSKTCLLYTSRRG